MYQILKRPPEVIAKAFMPGKEMKDFCDFCNSKKELYIYGAGRIGKGIAHFFEQCDIAFSGFVISDTFKEWIAEGYVEHETGVIIGIDDELLPEIENNLSMIANTDIYCLPVDIRRDMFLKSSVEYIEDNINLLLNIVGHCNLNCKGCKNFSPLCKDDFYDYSEIKHDLGRIKEIGVTKFNRIFVSGGEPLLHPDLFLILELCRSEFPDAIIELVSNGIILKSFSDFKWKELKRLNITLSLSNYPVLGNIFSNNIKSAESYGINYITMSINENMESDQENRTFVKWTINIDKKAPVYTYFSCKRFIGRTSIHMHKGFLYPCCTMAFSKYFSNYFGKGLKITDSDYLNLSNTTANEIFVFCIKRYPFCGYCDMEKNKLFPWSISEKKIEEWT